MLGRLRLSLLAVVLLMTVGCSDTLFFTTYTKFGVSASATQGKIPELQFGYNRFEGTIIPVERAEDGSTPAKAPSVFSYIDVDNRWFDGVTATQVFATGSAAVEAAKDKDGFAAIVKALKRTEEDGQD